MTDLQSFTLMMASAQVVETSVNTNNSPSQDYTTNPDDHSNHNIDSLGFKPFTVIPKIVIPGFCPIHFAVTFAGQTNADRSVNREYRYIEDR